MQPADVVARLLKRVGPAPDEGAVLSAVFQWGRGRSGLNEGEATTGETLRLRHASLVFGPPSMLTQSWPAWTESEGVPPTRFSTPDPVAPATFSYEGDGYVAGRVALDASAARAWLTAAVTTSVSSACGPLPAAVVSLDAPESFVRVFPLLDSPVSRLVTAAVRPLVGFLFPIQDDTGLSSGEAEAGSAAEREIPPPPDELVVASDWELSGELFYGACLRLLGMTIPNESHPMTPPARGLFVGRLEPGAWLTALRGNGKFTGYRIAVGFDRSVVEPASLEIELEETVDGEVVGTWRMPLVDWVPTLSTEPSPLWLDMPTLGVGTAYRVRLWSTDGVLFDTSRVMRLLRELRFRARVSDGESTAAHSFTVGSQLVANLDERLRKLDELEADFEAARERAADSRYISDAAGIAAVVSALVGAQGELLVQDPYFGKDQSSWDLLTGVNTPVRILSGPAATPPPTTLSTVKVRKWKPLKTQPLPAFHDRLYIWSTGGFMLGTSPNGLGNRSTHLVWLKPADADRSRTRFEADWADPGFEDAI